MYSAHYPFCFFVQKNRHTISNLHSDKYAMFFCYYSICDYGVER